MLNKVKFKKYIYKINLITVIISDMVFIVLRSKVIKKAKLNEYLGN